MHVMTFELSVFFIWLFYGQTEQFPRTKLAVNIGFIIDQNAESVKRAYSDAMAMSHVHYNGKFTEIRNFTDFTNIADTYLLTTSICSLLKKTVFTIIGGADISSYDAIESYSTAMQVPAIIYNDVRKIPKEEYKYVLHITPSYMPAIVDFVKFYKWRTVFYLHDENDPLWPWRVSEFFSYTDVSDNIQIIQRHLEDPYHCHDDLRNLDRMEIQQTEKIFIIDMANLTILESVMKQVTELGMNRNGYHYIIGGMDIQSFAMPNFIYGGVRITGLQLVDKNADGWNTYLQKWNVKTRYENGIPPLTLKEILFVDSVCFLQAGLEKIYRQEPTLFRTRGGIHYNTDRVKGVICHDNIPLERGPIILDLLRNTSASCLSGQVEFDQLGYRTNYHLDFYSLGYKQPLQKIGNWSSKTGYTDIIGIGITKHPRKHKGPYIVTVVVEPPFVIEFEHKNGSVTLEGYCIDMLRLIAKDSKLNLHYRIQKRNDNAYGNNNDGQWDGMIGELINGTADIALGSITITESRHAVVDFTKPFMDVGISIMIKRPDKQKPNVFSFKEPFSNKIWICILFGFAGVSLVLVLIGRFSPYEWQHNSATGPSEDFSVLNSLWSSFGALLQQGSDFLPSSVSGRIAECAWWFFTLIIVSSYTANLAAFLTIEKLNVPIDSAEALSLQTKIKYGFKAGGSTNDFFRFSSSSVYKRMYDFMVTTHPSPHVYNNTEGWDKVLAGKERYAYLVESTVNEYFNQKKPCKTMKVGKNLNQNGYGIATQKGSELSERLNLALLKLRETGELINLKQRWWYDKGQCGQASTSKGKQSLSLSNVAGTFHIVIAGLVLAMLFSALEFLFHFRKNKIKKKKKKKVIKTVLITDNDIQETKPLNSPTVNGAQDNKGGMFAAFKEEINSYQTTSPANLIMFDSITENGQTML